MSRQILHASTVAKDGQAMLITGASGSGKSTLALQLIGHGATLVADDRTALHNTGDKVVAAAAPNLAGLLEARHVGLLSLPFEADVPVAMVVDLDTPETDRLPTLRHFNLLGHDLPLYRRADGPHVPLSLLHCLMGNRAAP